MINQYSYFSHKNCEYYPCHRQAEEDNFNCLFCYCPLYVLGDACGGDFCYLQNGYKDCSACTYPHQREHYEEITNRYAEILAAMKKPEGQKNGGTVNAADVQKKSEV